MGRFFFGILYEFWTENKILAPIGSPGPARNQIFFQFRIGRSHFVQYSPNIGRSHFVQSYIGKPQSVFQWRKHKKQNWKIFYFFYFFILPLGSWLNDGVCCFVRACNLGFFCKWLVFRIGYHPGPSNWPEDSKTRPILPKSQNSSKNVPSRVLGSQLDREGLGLELKLPPKKLVPSRVLGDQLDRPKPSEHLF